MAQIRCEVVTAERVVFDDKVFLGVGQDPEHGDGPGHLYAIDATGRGDVTSTARVWHVGGEDFGRYGRELGAPSLLYRLGAAPPAAWEESRQPGGAPLPALHSSRFAPDAERALDTGVRATVVLLTDVLD